MTINACSCKLWLWTCSNPSPAAGGRPPIHNHPPWSLCMFSVLLEATTHRFIELNGLYCFHVIWIIRTRPFYGLTDDPWLLLLSSHPPPLSLSFLQSLLSVHDTVAQKSYDPILPPLPDDIDDDEDSVKIIRLVKNKEPLVSSAGGRLEKWCGRRTWRFVEKHSRDVLFACRSPVNASNIITSSGSLLFVFTILMLGK